MLLFLGCEYVGAFFVDSYAASAKQQNTQGTVLASNHMFRIEHTVLNLAQTDLEGWKLTYIQIPCGGVIADYTSTGL